MNALLSTLLASLSKRWKAVGAFLSLVAAWLVTALADGHIDPAEWAGLAVVILGTFTVHQVKNEP